MTSVIGKWLMPRVNIGPTCSLSVLVLSALTAFTELVVTCELGAVAPSTPVLVRAPKAHARGVQKLSKTVNINAKMGLKIGEINPHRRGGFKRHMGDFKLKSSNGSFMIYQKDSLCSSEVILAWIS